MSLALLINTLEQRFIHDQPAIESWLSAEWMEHTPPFYSSVDIRNAGFKVASVDTNLFPGGFNNLHQSMLSLAMQASVATVERHCPDAHRVLIIPENHTRNVFYFENLAMLMQIFQAAGLYAKLGTLDEAIQTYRTIELPNGRSIELHELVRKGNRLCVKDFDPCVILLNNDLSGGVPDILQNLTEQAVLPPISAGWYTRRKSNHFQLYDQVVKNFSEWMGIDSWVMNPLFATVGGLDFSKASGAHSHGIQELEQASDELLLKIKKKYREYSIDSPAFLIVKADAGTYGMGVMTIRDASDIKNLNRKARNKMAVIKDGLVVDQVLLQEGIPSIEKVANAVAEPVIYMIDRYVVGGFYRSNPERNIDENLNASGMRFSTFDFADHFQLIDTRAKPGTYAPNLFYLYGVIARLAALAASLELETGE